MRKLTSFIFTLLSFASFAQGIQIIEYRFDMMGLKGVKSFAVSDSENLYYFFSQNKEMTYDKLDAGEKNINPYYIFKYNYDKKIFYHTFNLTEREGAKGFSNVKDYVPKINWKISKEMKKILDYNCTLATTTFRGRNYKVWFTTEIPLEIFPWKLSGLPGAVLAFEEDQGFFNGEATRIIRNFTDSLPRNLSKYINDKSIESAVSYKKYVTIDNTYLEDQSSREIAEMPKGIDYLDVPLRSSRLEMYFEWESKP